MTPPETIMICIDSSVYMKYFNRYIYELQLDCIRLYCEPKLKSNRKRKNTIGIVRMGTYDDNHLSPTWDLDQILHNLQNDHVLGGVLDFEQGIKSALYYLDKESKQRKKRILLFVGGRIFLDDQEIDALAKLVKQSGVAVDVVHFWLKDEYYYSQKLLHSFVYVASDKNNSNLMHFVVEPSTSPYDIISRDPDIFPEAVSFSLGKRMTARSEIFSLFKTTVAKETLMICIDDSMSLLNSHDYLNKLQLDCIRLYCQLKLKSNPNNVIGILTLGSLSYLMPTSDSLKIMHKLQYEFGLGGLMKFSKGVKFAVELFSYCELTERKRVLLFTGGGYSDLNYLDIEQVEDLGKYAKESGVAIDVFNLLDEYGFYQRTKTALDAFFRAFKYDNSNNHHMIDFTAEPTTSPVDIISRHPHIFSLEEREIVRNKKANDNEKAKNQVAAHDERVKARGEHKTDILRNKKVKVNEKAKNQAAAPDERVKARGKKRDTHNHMQLQNSFAALSLAS
ncbi:uncharacterized protein [Rutidosis leptorrhynchoides]|uniref:uncharacterized protein n=1 Tax=Rutidosis leptorrhynchoides TaxID=125765 RepID=UPI003A996B90